MSEITYHRATVADIPAVIENRIAFLTDFFGQESEEKMHELRYNLLQYLNTSIPNDTYICWMAKDGNKVAGTGAMVVNHFAGNFKNPLGRMGYIMSMYTFPAYRRQGIASTIVKNLVATAKELGIGMIDLHASKEGAPVYEQCGFTLHTEPTYRIWLTGADNK